MSKLHHDLMHRFLKFLTGVKPDCWIEYYTLSFHYAVREQRFFILETINIKRYTSREDSFGCLFLFLLFKYFFIDFESYRRRNYKRSSRHKRRLF